MKKSLLILFGIVGISGISKATTCGSETLIPAAPTMPYTQALTCGGTNDINSGNVSVCGSTSYVGGQEALYAWTPSLDYSGVTIQYTGQTWTGIFIWAGCPTTGGTCIANITSGASSKTLVIPGTLTAGVTYFIMFDTYPTPNSPCPGSFTLNGTPVIPAPPTPTQAGGTPDCLTGTTIDVAGTAPTDMIWYWQSSASGTDLSDPYAGPFTIFANGTYYIRTQHTPSGLWSTASSITVTNFPVATTPPAPTADLNPSCVTTGTILTADPAPMGTEYYWQETNSSGTSNLLPATATYAVSTSGTYYLAAYETGTGCWSTTSSIVVTVDTYIPAEPTATPNAYYLCSGDLTEMITATAPSSGSVSYIIGSNLISTGDAPTTVPFLVNALPAGATITSAILLINSAEALGASYRSEIRIALSGDYTLAQTQISALSSSGLITPDPTINLVGFPVNGGSMNLVITDTYNDGGNDAQIGQVSLIINYNLPAATIEWFDASTAGTNVGSGSPFESIGTTVLGSPALAGTYSFFAESASGACVSANRTEVTIYVSDVVVELLPVDLTCNNGNDGSFTLGTVTCGASPFTYSVDGGSFGPIPTNLTLGDHNVIVQDAGSQTSGTYVVTIGNAPAPTALSVTGFTNDNIDITWTAGGTESEWHIEWGAPGFMPGTGTEIGSANANSNSYTISGLSGYTTYDIYVAADCGSGTTAGDWVLVTETTMCDPFDAQAFCENFDSGSPTQPCWTVDNANADADSWNMDYTSNTYSGDQTASIYTDYNAGANDDWLITPQLILTNNEIFSFYYRVQSSGEPNDMEVLLSTTGTDPADFTTTLIPLATYSNTTYSLMTLDLSAYSGEVFIAFHIPAGGSDGWYMYVDQVCFDICIPDAGTDGSTDVCRLDNTLDLNTVIVQGETNGVWEFLPNPGVVSGSDLNLSLLPDGTYEVEYIVTTACTTDTTVATVTVHSASSAGTGSTISDICSNHTAINLMDGISGTIDLGGTWTNNSGEGTLTGSVWNPALTTMPGSYTFDYVVNNGFCPNDTSTVTVDVIDCTGIDENENSFISVYPNPVVNELTIQNLSVDSGVIDVLDIQGKVVKSIQMNGVYGNYILNMNELQRGMYVIRITTENSFKEARVVKL